MQNTPPKRSPEARDADELVEDLCVALRDVGVGDWYLPDDERAVRDVREVKVFAAELRRRGIDVAPRIDRLSAECNWQMDALLRDCLDFPTSVPYVRESDGVRRVLRCARCRTNEQTMRGAAFAFCPSCLEVAIGALRSARDEPGLFLYRTVTAAMRCVHADDATPLVTALDYHDTAEPGRCEQCLTVEQARQRAAASAPARS